MIVAAAAEWMLVVVVVVEAELQRLDELAVEAGKIASLAAAEPEPVVVAAGCTAAAAMPSYWTVVAVVADTPAADSSAVADSLAGAVGMPAELLVDSASVAAVTFVHEMCSSAKDAAAESAGSLELAVAEKPWHLVDIQQWAAAAAAAVYYSDSAHQYRQ